MRRLHSAAACAAACLGLVSSASFASTLGYWNFDTNTLGTQAPGVQVPHATAGGIFDGTTPDLSGNGNHLSVWDTSGAGFQYRADHPTIAGNPSNTYSIKNSGGGPAAMTIDRNNNPTSAQTSLLNTGTFAQFTVEASYKPETGGYRTVVARDARNVATSDNSLAAFYLQLQPDNSVAVKFTDVSGFFHIAATAAGFADQYDFNFPDDNEGTTGKWLNLAGVSDGSTLKLYVDGVVVASTDLTASGSSNTALAVGTDVNPGDDWTSGGWAVGRGLYNGGHVDRGYGFIDEVRISDSALGAGQLLAAVPEPTSLTLGVAAMGLLARRRRA